MTGSGVCSTTKRCITSVSTALLQSLRGTCRALLSSDVQPTEAAANTHTHTEHIQTCRQVYKRTYATSDALGKAQPHICILEYTRGKHTQYLGISGTGEYGSRGGKGRGRERDTCAREIKVEQTAAPIEENGLLKERIRKKSQTEKQ